MKKTIFTVIIVGMFAWAIYDFAFQSDKGTVSSNGVAEENKEVIGLEKGNMAPDFELPTLEGETVKLSDFRGKRVMVNFWATWCPPCRAEMPDMQKFHENTDVVILAVNLTDSESSPKNVPRFIDNFGLTFPVLLDENSEVADLYRIQPIPTSYMIDSKGKVHYKAFGALNYESMVQEFEKMK